MRFQKKERFEDMPRLPGGEATEVARAFTEKAARWINRMSKAGFLLLIVGFVLALFIFFKWLNRGQVSLLTSGDNIINMTALLVMAEFLDNLWDFNGDDSMGWGGM